MNKQKIFDSHAHYDHEQFDCDREGLLASLPEKGVCAVLNVGCDMESSRKSVRLAASFRHICAGVGVHPHSASEWREGTEDELRELLKAEKVVAIGEIGLDYHYDFSPRDVQRIVFARQLEMSKELDIPVVIHDREAHGDMYEILRKYAPLRGVMHCFSGSVELMREALAVGLHIGIGGSLTFKNAVHPIDVAREVPEDKFLLETDCPYMSPVPKRGTRNDSSNIIYVAEKMAEIRGCTADDIIRTAMENTIKLFGFDPDKD